MVMRIGIVGTGNIAPAYMTGSEKFPDDIQVVACADILPERASTFASTYNLRALTIEELLADPEIDIVINLTVPAVHADVSVAILKAGKHVYLEKPLGLTREEGEAILSAAQIRNLRVGCAPDTFLGAGGQTARRAIDSGLIGKPIGATAFMAGHGPESWHPNPTFFYQFGGGPLFDMGPYYLTALVNLLGPIESIAAVTTRGFETRYGDKIQQDIPVNVDTHYSGSLRFVEGATATVMMSFDVWRHQLPIIEIYGTEGTLSVPDPNSFGGDVKYWKPSSEDWIVVEPVGRSDIQRGVGVADMARMIQAGKPHRASGDLAFHVLDAMVTFGESSNAKTELALKSTVNRPEAL